MALIQRGPSLKKQIQLAITLIFVVGATLGVMYFGIFKKPSAAPDVVNVTILRDSAAKKNSSLDDLEKLKQQSLYSNLKRFGT